MTPRLRLSPGVGYRNDFEIVVGASFYSAGFCADVAAAGFVGSGFRVEEIVGFFFGRLHIGSGFDDHDVDEQELMGYIGRHSVNWLPDLIIFDSPPVHPDTATLISAIRDQRSWKIIPIALFLAPHDIPKMMTWLRDKRVYYYPQGARPSDCKYYLKQILHLHEVV